MYFGRIPAGPAPPGVRTVEPEQKRRTERSPEGRITAYLASSDIKGIRQSSSDAAVYEVISDILSSGRTSRLYKSLIRDKKLAIQAQGFLRLPR